MALLRGSDIPDELGYGIAEAMDLDAVCDLGEGVAGKVFALDDGRVLKVTLHANEAAVAQLVMERAPGFDGPLFPAIDDVRSVEVDGQAVYAIVRDDILSPGESVGTGDDPRARRFREEWWQVFVGGLGRNPAMALRGVAALGEDGPAAAAFLRGLAEMLAEGFVDPSELSWDNIGKAGDGRLVVRDHSHFVLPAAAQDSTLGRVAPVPAASPSPWGNK